MTAACISLWLLTAASPGDHRPVQVALGLGSSAPIDVSVVLNVEVPGRLQLGSSFGFMPRGYFNFINRSLVRYDAYSEEDSALIDAALDRALVWRSHLGWRPIPSSGFTVSATYTLVGLGGRTTAAEALSAVTGLPLPEDVNFEAQVTSRLHQLGGELGWRWRLGDRVGLELALGGGYTFSASTEIRPDAPGVSVLLLTPFTSAGERYLDDKYRTWFHSAYVAVRGYYWVL